MASERFSRGPDEGAPDEVSEGVRLIGADEAEKAAERGGVARRRDRGQPRYGDRPESPPDDVEPAIRFPLPDSADPSHIERPRPAPVERPTAAGSARPQPDPTPTEATPVVLGPSGPGSDEPLPQPPLVTREDLGGEADEVFPAPPAADAFPPPPAAEAEADRPDLPPPPSPDRPTPLLDFGPPTGEHELPHWTAPATGEVPRVVIGEGEAEPGEEERWSSFAAGSTRWRDEHDTSDHGDLLADLGRWEPGDEGDHRLGALDTSDRLSDDAFLNFDDVDLSGPEPARRGRRGFGRGRAEAPPPPPPADAPAPPPPAAAPPPPLDDALPPPPAVVEEPPARPHLGAAAPPPPPDEDPAAPRARRRPPEPPEGTGGGRDVPQAVIVGGAIAIVGLLAFWLGPAATMVLTEIVIVLAGAEYFGAVYRGGFRPATLLGLAAVAALPVATYWKGEGAIPLILFLAVAVGVLWYLLGVGGRVRPTANLGVTLLGVVWIGVLGAFAALILAIPDQGVSILLVTVVAAVAHDVGGFFLGRTIGHTPLTDISPNKTVEGLVGGILSALIGVFVFAVLLGFGPFSTGQALVFGICTALAAPLGDLAESLFKRDLGLKDMGHLLPQHGGVLDRFDGMLFVLPTAYLVTRALGLA